MAYKKIDVSASEMRTLREQGYSNKDIANLLEISLPTVNRYIGPQGRRMESMAAFKTEKHKGHAIEDVETPEIKRAVDEIVVRTERLSSKNGNSLADVDYISHTVCLDVGTLTFDELPEFATFIIGMVERINREVKK